MIALFTLAATLLCAASLAAQHPRELAVVWPSPEAPDWTALRQLKADSVVIPFSGQRPPGAAGLKLIAELPPQPARNELERNIESARRIGFDGVAITAPSDAADLRPVLAAHGGYVHFVYLKPDQINWDVAPARAVMLAGLWPGLQAADTESAAATEKPWINANLHLYAWLRAHQPGRVAWLRTEAPKPDARYDSVEVALAESFAAGGSALLQLPELYREGLRRKTPRALQSWDSLCTLAERLRQFPGMEQARPGSSTAILTGAFEDFEELLNLPFRNNLSPRVIPAGAPVDLRGARVAVAVNRNAETRAATAVLDHVRTGGILVAAPESTGEVAWVAAAKPRKVKEEKPWSVWSLGKGRIYLYPEAIIDPSEFAYDLREISGLDNPSHTGLHGLDFRVWNASTVLGILYEAADGGKRLVLLSYGQGMNRDFLVGVRGSYSRGTLRQPGVPDQTLELMQRDWFVETNLKAAGRVAVVELEGATP